MPKQLTKADAQNAEECATEIMDAFPKSKKVAFFGHFNELLLFIGACKQQLPDAEEKPDDAS
jgi:hypothetical protein